MRVALGEGFCAYPLACRHDGSVTRSFANLTEREQQVVTLVGEGLSNKLIARRLEVSEGTIKAHLHSVFRKLGIRSRIMLIPRAMTGLTTSDDFIGAFESKRPGAK